MRASYALRLRTEGLTASEVFNDWTQAETFSNNSRMNVVGANDKVKPREARTLACQATHIKPEAIANRNCQLY